jgi:methylase of polypeptide subunit release factors
MASATEIVYRLTQASLTASERQRSLHDFAEATGWYPSDEIVEYPGTQQYANGHLLVEHGMASTAVISFLKPESNFSRLASIEKLRLLEISYNNLVDWHLLPDATGLTAVYNRTDPAGEFRAVGPDAWRAEAFANVTDHRARPELKALDDALISTISYWKRAIGGELGKRATNERLSGLFNVLIFIRAFEDHRRRLGPVREALLVNLIAEEPTLPLGLCCRKAMRKLGRNTFPSVIRSQAEHLDDFDKLSPEVVRELIADFYKNRYCPYRYDFSLISKHALSRIYEHYVSVLARPESDQMRLFPDMAEEKANKTLGSYYTPQYIARFFARYLQEHTTPRQFREMKIADPACGSGIFLRTALELRADPLDPVNTADSIKSSFRQILGLDIDSNACDATRLSLSLLHLVLTDEFPKSLNVLRKDAIEFVQENEKELKTYGAVIANPPYIRSEALNKGWRRRAALYLGGLAHGKFDAYVAILKVGLDLLKAGGFAMYVVPHSFLYADSAQGLRQLITDQCWVCLLADLSDLKVFEDVSSYTVLLIVQRKEQFMSRPSATVVKCRSAVGDALSTALRGRSAENESFRVFECDQDVFQDGTWKLLPPKQHELVARMSRLPELSALAEIYQGVITGADSIFIRSAQEIPKRESQIWRPLLSDREMTPYSVPADTECRVFYPFDGTREIDLEKIERTYPETWKYLGACKRKLQARGSLARGGIAWWRPLWPRNPTNLFSPKIVCPHLMLTPRFALDAAGKFAVTHSSFIVPNSKTVGAGIDFLKYLVAVLNSAVGFWQVTVQSHKYGRRYAMLEGKTLKTFRVPDPRLVPRKDMQQLVSLVSARLEDGYSEDRERAIDERVAELYGLSRQELESLGII